MLHTTQARPFAGHSSSLRPQPFTPSRVSRGSLQVQNAITRQKKEEIVADLKEKLNNSIIVFGLRYKGLDVATFEKFRKGIPESCSVKVCKNSLMRVACRDVEGWSPIADTGCSGENAWVFVHEDDIADAVKHFYKFTDDLEKEAKANAPKGVEVAAPTSISCAAMDGKLLTDAELKRCENLPNKKQLYTTIARMLKQPARKLAVGIKQVPTKLAYGIRAISELDEDKTKLAGDVAKPKSA